MEARLQVKLGDAARAVGVAGAILPGLSQSRPAQSRSEERIDETLRAWRRSPAPAHPVCAAVRAARPGAIVALRQRGGATLLAIDEDHVTDSRDAVEAVLRHAPIIVDTRNQYGGGGRRNARIVRL